MRLLTFIALPLLVACQAGDDEKDDVLQDSPSDADADADADSDVDADADADADTDTDTDTDTVTDTDVTGTETGSTPTAGTYPSGAVEPMRRGGASTSSCAAPP